LAENGADVASQNNEKKTPEDLIYDVRGISDQEKLWLTAALGGKLTEKDSIKAQEAKIKNDRPSDVPPEIREVIDKPDWFLRLRKFQYGTVEWNELKDVKFKPPPLEEGLSKRDLPRADFTHLQAIKRASKPHLPCALIFPGIGSQYVGMMKDIMDNPPVKVLLDRAQEILGWDVRQLALEGPEDKISQPLYGHPLLFIACNAAMELAKSKHEEQYERVQCVAGLSLGEYSALVAADVFDFDVGLRLVKLRAEALDNALNTSEQSMCSVAGLSRDTIEGLCYDAVSSTQEEGATCQISSSMFPSGFAISGTRNAVTKLMTLAKEAQALQCRATAGAGGYHTPLMRSAEDALEKALQDALPEMRPPRCAIYFNRSGKKVAKGTDPRNFINLLKEQLTHEVLWETSMKNMLVDGVQDFIEVGPMKQLKAMMKRIDQDAFQHTTNVNA
jgi:[acyl-carrier-protein] S-malonyltransferase